MSYLKAWVDPDVPDGWDPYVHIFLKDGSDSETRAPSNHSHFWHEVLDLVEAEGETFGRKEDLVPPGRWSYRRKGMTLGGVQQIADQTLQHMLLPFIRTEAKRLSRMQLLVLCTKDDPGFITSDAPVVWYDPDWNEKWPMRRSPSFKDPRLEISLPVSPSQALLLIHGPVGVRYVDVDNDVVVEINSRTRLHCDEHFVVRRAYLERSWFDGKGRIGVGARG